MKGVGDLKAFPTNFKLALQERVWEGDRKFASGKILSPVSFHDFIHEHYPAGIGASYEIVENLIRCRADVLAIWTDVTKRKPGRPEKSASETVDNVHGLEERPTGNSAAAGLRKLQKAAEEGNSEAERELVAVIDGRKKVHTACVDAGIRKTTRIEAARIEASDCEGAGIKTVRRIFQRGMADVPDLPSAEHIADADAWGALFTDITSGRRPMIYAH